MSDANYSSVTLLLSMDGASGATTFTDTSPTPKAITANGGAKVNTSVVKYGTGSCILDGTGDYLSVADSTDFNFGNTCTISNASPGVVTWAGHGLQNGNCVTLFTTGALPTGLAVATKYYVVNKATDTFELSATSGGASINTSSAGSGTHTVNADGTIEGWVYLLADSTADAGGSRNAEIFGSYGTGDTTFFEFRLIGDASLTGTNIVLATSLAGVAENKTPSTAIPVGKNTWHFLSVSWDTSGVYFAIDGVVTAAASAFSQIIKKGSVHRIGGLAVTGYPRELNGHLEDIRITKGVCRYTANYTVPTKAFDPFGLIVDYDTVTDTLYIAPESIKGYPATGEDTLNITPALGAITLISELSDYIDTGDSSTMAGKYGRSVEDILSVLDEARIARPMSVSETVTGTAAAVVSRPIAGSDTFTVNPAVSLTTKNGVVVTDTITTEDVVAYFFGMSASDTFTLLDAVTPSRKISTSVSDQLTLTGAASFSMVVRIDVADTFELDENASFNTVIGVAVAEGFTVSALISGPTSQTVWVMNTKTRAVTEYAGWDFNSFAKLGQRYLGANTDGIFWLDGNTDDGVDIPTAIATGILQPHGNKLASVEYAYIGIRGDGRYQFRITDEAGESYDYDLDATSMKTARVQFGRGFRTRYFTFRIASASHDYDLDSVEFITRELIRKV